MIDADQSPQGWRIELVDRGTVHAVTFGKGLSYAVEASVELPMQRTGMDRTTIVRGNARTRTEALRELFSRVASSGYQASLLAPWDRSRAELVAEAQADARRIMEAALGRHDTGAGR